MIKPIAIYFEHCETDPQSQQVWRVPEALTTNHILLLMTRGSLEYTIMNRTCFLSKGDMLFVPQGVIRHAVNPSREPHEMYVAHFQNEGLEDETPLLSEGTFHMARLTNFDYIRHRFSLLTQHWIRKSTHTRAFCHSILLELLATLAEEADRMSIPGKAYGIVVQLQEYILQHYRGTLTMDELSRYVGKTPNYVSAIFKQATGQTVMEYAHQVRISVACDLLAGSQMSIGEISDFLGYCEQSYFNKVFKKVTGLSPSIYVKEKVKIWL
ncbi:AraC family transcriptional regulator [Paenibacillus sp. HB172176]|uniref:helix-turn-helix domain-containing protein n=1 Tax=Paenibacillus sp. HB172176 TaxID=2493690 RepID=UPI00143B5169|nr:AraC family transcriptional regulator [Paenibacillus sp. HB172176]